MYHRYTWSSSSCVVRQTTGKYDVRFPKLNQNGSYIFNRKKKKKVARHGTWIFVQKIVKRRNNYYSYPDLDSFHSTFCIGLQGSGSPSLVVFAVIKLRLMIKSYIFNILQIEIIVLFRKIKRRKFLLTVWMRYIRRF